jgi:hypothetical protein
MNFYDYYVAFAKDIAVLLENINIFNSAKDYELRRMVKDLTTHVKNILIIIKNIIILYKKYKLPP